MPATDGISENLFARDAALGCILRQAAGASIPLALMLGAFLVSRRTSGELQSGLPPLTLIATAALLLAWAMMVRAMLRSRRTAWLIAAALLLFAIGCSFPGESAVDWLAWLTVFGVFVASVNVEIAPQTHPRRSPIDTDTVLQQLTRTRTSSGHDILQGTLLAEFAARERIATLYVGFCPPFERRPFVELESAVDARLVQAFHHGAQVEVRLARPAASPTTAYVEIFATDSK